MDLQDEQQVLTTLVGLLGNAIHAAEVLHTLEERVAERSRELRALYSITALAYAPLETMLARSLEMMLPAMSAEIGMVHLMAGQGAPPRLAACRGLSADEVAELASLPPREQWWAQVIAQDKPVFLCQDPQGGPLGLSVPCLARARACLGIPIRAPSGPIGALSVLSQATGAFSVEQMALLRTIADEMGAAVAAEALRASAEGARIAQERQRLARDLHDAVTQSIYSLTLFAEAARDMGQAGRIDRTLDYLERIGRTAHQALKEMRLLIYQLRPSALQSAGLVNALQQRLDAVEKRAGMRTRLVADGYAAELPPAVADSLYRIAQEILNNVLKHAEATQVTVELTSDGAWAELLVRDDGRGFEPEVAFESGGMGLANMRQRVEEMGGALTIRAAPGQGAELTVRVPAARDHDGRAARPAQEVLP